MFLFVGIPIKFQHTAARRRLGFGCIAAAPICSVSTHSRPKAAGFIVNQHQLTLAVSTHSRPKAAGSY